MMLENYKGKKVLILAPHTDDGELGCGGTIAKLAEQGAQVYYMVFSICTNSLPEGLASDTLSKEVRAATLHLGIPTENLILHDYDVRTFSTHRQNILDDLIKFRNEINPDLVFLPAPTDIHQDHEVISQEGIRAFKQTNILGYEMPWNNLSFSTRCFVKLNEHFIGTKIKALKEYKSQIHRDYFNEIFIKSLAYTRGVQVGCSYAEAFEVVRILF
jgi:LmbE family N-acetylglucosaminyl deacetylase